MSKGETLIDTAVTLNAMRPDILVVRHHAAGAVELLAQKVDCSVINAGDGAHEHPTQALLDALTIRRAQGPHRRADRGDLRRHPAFARRPLQHPPAQHARRARARHRALDAACRPASSGSGSRSIPRMREGLKDADIVMMLRLQRERMSGALRAVAARIFPLLRARRTRSSPAPSPMRWSCIRAR